MGFMHKHQPHVVADVISALEGHDLHVMQARVEDLQDTDRAKLYLRPVDCKVTCDMLADVKKSVIALFERHQRPCIMVKRVLREEVTIDHLPSHRSMVDMEFTGLIQVRNGYEICIDVVDADVAINEISRALKDLDLNVTSAEVQHREALEQVHGMIFVQCPYLAGKRGTGDEARARRQEIAMRLRRMMEDHDLFGSISINTWCGTEVTSPIVIESPQPSASRSSREQGAVRIPVLSLTHSPQAKAVKSPHIGPQD